MSNFEHLEPKKSKSIGNHPDRVYLKPSDECTNVLTQYCVEGKEISPSGMRAICTSIIKLTESKQLNTVDPEHFIRLFKYEDSLLEQSTDPQNFPFDLITLSLKILAQPDMPLSIYNDDEITKIITKIKDLCTDILFKPTYIGTEIQNLSPILRSFAHIIDFCTLRDSPVINLLQIANTAYFKSNILPGIQNSACSLLVSIFKRYPSFREDIINDAFIEVRTNPGISKFLTFSNNQRHSISALTRLILELVQSISSYPNDTDSTTNGLIEQILPFFSQKTITLDKFASEISICLTHPFYPIANLFLIHILSGLFEQLNSKAKDARNASKTICTLISSIGKVFNFCQTSYAIQFPFSLLASFSGYDSDRITTELQLHDTSSSNSDIKSELKNQSESNPDKQNKYSIHLYEENEAKMVELTIEPPTPRGPAECTELEILAIRLIILMYIRQSRLHNDEIETSIPFFISEWSKEELSSDAFDTMLMWWKGKLPDSITYEWTIEIAETLYKTLLGRTQLYIRVHLLYKRLLQGLTSANSSVRAQILKGFSFIIEQEPEMLFSEDLVPVLEPAFLDPSPSIRQSALEIISKYISGENGQHMSSPYFNIIINCLDDKTPTVVKTALQTVKILSHTATPSQLSNLIVLLIPKLNDKSDSIQKLTDKTITETLFELSSDTISLLIETFKSLLIKPDIINKCKWLRMIIKRHYSDYNKEVSQMIQELFKRLESIEKPLPEMILLTECLCCTLPRICCNYYQTMLTIFRDIDTSENNLIIELSNSLKAIIPEIPIPNTQEFQSILDLCSQKMFIAKNADVVRSLTELSIIISTEILHDDFIQNLAFQYLSVLRKALQQLQTTSSSQIKRSLLGYSSIVRYHTFEEGERMAKQLFPLAGQLFKKTNDPIIKSFAVDSCCACCLRDPDLMPKSRLLLQDLFNGSDGDRLAALKFILTLAEEEPNFKYQVDLDEVRPLACTELFKRYEEQISNAASSSNFDMRKTAIYLLSTCAKNSFAPPQNTIIPLFSSLCYLDTFAIAMPTLSMLSTRYPSEFSTSLKQSFQLIFQQNMKINSSCLSQQNVILGRIYHQINEKGVRREFLKICVYVLEEAIQGGGDKTADFAQWIAQGIADAGFEFAWEPAFLNKEIDEKELCAYSQSEGSELKDAMKVFSQKKNLEITEEDYGKWRTATVILALKMWLIEKYGWKNVKKDALGGAKEIPAKVSKIPPLQLWIYPKPDSSNKLPHDKLMDLYAHLQSLMRRERAHESRRQKEEK